MSGVFVGQYEEEVGLSRRRAIRALWELKTINAHQPPKRGERRDMVLSQCYKAIEDGHNMIFDSRVAVDVEVDVDVDVGVGVDVGLT